MLKRIKLPRSKAGRIALGWALVAGGTLGFLPILGFWMLPLGFAVLSIDLPGVRRRRRVIVVWWQRRRRRRSQAGRSQAGRSQAGNSWPSSSG